VTDAAAVCAQLAALEKSMRDFLALLANSDLQPERLERVWAACQRHDEHLAQVGPALAGASREEKAEVAARLAQLRCLNAVAVAELERHRGLLAQSLGRTRRTRVHLDANAPAERLGASCDVAG
jgi:hypothetical protein